MARVTQAQAKAIVEQLEGWKKVSDLPRGAFGLNLTLVHEASGMNGVLKILDPDPKLIKGQGQNELRARFAREMQILNKIESEYIPRFYGGSSASVPPWMLMQYVPGEDIKTIVKNRGRLRDALWFEVIEHTLRALADLHALGFVHNDLNPGNVRVSTGGNHQLLDFGISKKIGDRDPNRLPTMDGWANMLAPERFANGTVGPQSDVFSLGTLMVYAATGKHPWPETSMDAFVRAQMSGRGNYFDMSAAQVELLRQMHIADPRKRPSAADLVPVAIRLAGKQVTPATVQPAAQKASSTPSVQGKAVQPTVGRNLRQFGSKTEMMVEVRKVTGVPLHLAKDAVEAFPSNFDQALAHARKAHSDLEAQRELRQIAKKQREIEKKTKQAPTPTKTWASTVPDVGPMKFWKLPGHMIVLSLLSAFLMYFTSPIAILLVTMMPGAKKLARGERASLAIKFTWTFIYGIVPGPFLFALFAWKKRLTQKMFRSYIAVEVVLTVLFGLQVDAMNADPDYVPYWAYILTSIRSLVFCVQILRQLIRKASENDTAIMAEVMTAVEVTAEVKTDSTTQGASQHNTQEKVSEVSKVDERESKSPFRTLPFEVPKREAGKTAQTWDDVNAMILAELSRKKGRNFSLEVDCKRIQGIYFQGYTEEGGFVTIEASANLSVRPNLTEEQHLALVKLGWQPPSEGLPNYIRFLDLVDSEPEAIATHCLLTIREGYGLAINEFTINSRG